MKKHGKIKRSFITGLIILLPLAITIILVVFIINLLTEPFLHFFTQFLSPFPWYHTHQLFVQIALRIALLLALFFGTVFLGFLARIVAFKSLLSLYDYIFHRIPIIKTVYKATQQFIRTLFGTSSRSFKQVVMVPFPKETGSYCIGLVSGTAPTLCSKSVGSALVTVYVPTPPNPTSGLLMMYREDQVMYLDMKVEEAIKYIISCGIISSDEMLQEDKVPETLYPL